MWRREGCWPRPSRVSQGAPVAHFSKAFAAECRVVGLAPGPQRGSHVPDLRRTAIRNMVRTIESRLTYFMWKLAEAGGNRIAGYRRLETIEDDPVELISPPRPLRRFRATQEYGPNTDQA